MTAPRLSLAIAIGFASAVIPVSAHMPEQGQSSPDRTELEAQMIVNQFFNAVARGGLELFGTPVIADQLVPRRVQTVYDLQTHRSTREVYAELRSPIPVPGQDECEVRGISVLMDAFGRILESSAHVWCE